ncbi:MAG: zinc-ribbon domain-containing protein [Deltaproteobacteria bacterium]|nr:zinc-ribbon domain-containing protein [Deltaproteobacteria bacterium]
MIIECDKCKSLFRLDEGLLREEGSKVRCSVCKHVFISYPPGAEIVAKENQRSIDQRLGETVTLESSSVFEEEARESLPEHLEDENFEAVFEEEGEEGFDLIMEDQEGGEIEPGPALVKPPALKAKKIKPDADREVLTSAEKELRIPARRRGNSKLLLIIFVILLLLFGGAAAIVYFSPELVPDRLTFLKTARKTEPADLGVQRLRFTSVTGVFIQNPDAGQLFVVRGAISNNYQSSRSYVLVKASILDDKGKVVKTKVAYAGNVFTEDELQNLSMEQIDQGLREKAGKADANVDIKPQASVPFMVVFEKLPDNLSEFTVEPVSSSPGR